MAKARKKSKYRSSMEQRIVPPLLAHGAQYEPVFLRFFSRMQRRYIPDVALPNGIAIEIKGWFKPSDRTKTLDVLAAYPELDLRLVLGNPDTVLAPGSKTTLAMWCEKNGIKWARRDVPQAWLDEPLNAASKAILDAAPRRKVSV